MKYVTAIFAFHTMTGTGGARKGKVILEIEDPEIGSSPSFDDCVKS